jgi:biotin carboxyl carrier protein
MKRDLIVGGRAATLAIEGTRFHYQREGGESVEGEFCIQAAGPGVFSVLIEGRSYRATLGPPGEMLVNGYSLAVEAFDPRDAPARKSGSLSHGRQQVAAPMPGKIVRTLVTPGDPVEEGQGLVVVEAMKMQNEMKSPKAGRVTEVRAKPGASVAAGEVLVVVE